MRQIIVRGTALGDGIPKTAVPLMAEDEAGCLTDAAEAIRAGSEILELRADALRADLCRAPKLHELLCSLRKTAGDVPVLFTFRTKAEGGRREADDAEYAGIVRDALNSRMVDLIDIEQERTASADLLEEAHAVSVPAVLSFHDFRQTPPLSALEERLEAMKDAGADLAKIAVTPRDHLDPSRVLAASAWAKQHLGMPFVLISMGEIGRITRLSAAFFGSVFTFGCLPGRDSAPGQMEVPALRAKMREAAGAKRKEGAIFLNGFMGSGKTTVGAALAAKTGRPFIDLDQRIEEREGCAVSRIFETKGQPYFRDLETREIAELYHEGPAVVSCGGGAVLRTENTDLMRCLGRIVLLRAKPETVLERLTGEAANRPNIRGRMTRDGIRRLMEERKARYEEAADQTIDTDGKTPEQIADEILESDGFLSCTRA